MKPLSSGKTSIEKSDTVLNQTTAGLIMLITDTLMVGLAPFGVKIHELLWTLAHGSELTKVPNHSVIYSLFC
jgi:hypothetical protein